FIAGQAAELYEQNGAPPGGKPIRILAAIQRRDETAWFFKMTGDNQLVSEQKPVFVEFLKSIQFPAPSMALPVGHPDISQMPPNTMAATTLSNAGRPQWQVPSDWKEVPPGQILLAKFVVGDGNVQAAVNISSSNGNGGGLEANVNRWRKQLGL